MSKVISSIDKQTLIVVAAICLPALVTRLAIGNTSTDFSMMVISTAIGGLAVWQVLSSFSSGKIIGKTGYIYKLEGSILFSSIQIIYGYFGVLFLTFPHNFGLGG